jgi:hypothetical protein
MREPILVKRHAGFRLYDVVSKATITDALALRRMGKAVSARVSTTGGVRG